jgi:hypothetical protein
MKDTTLNWLLAGVMFASLLNTAVILLVRPTAPPEVVRVDSVASATEVEPSRYWFPTLITDTPENRECWRVGGVVDISAYPGKHRVVVCRYAVPAPRAHTAATEGAAR